MSATYTKSYLHHLFKTKEVIGLRIATEHNLHFYYQLMKKIREEITSNNFIKWSTQFIDKYKENRNE